ncbi:MAG TPA: POTRA domain-containing protein [Steroidobacteraceae bacterium]|nr:POTRA domain-containing protein [Steroidobacteraceae bacterium]
MFTDRHGGGGIGRTRRGALRTCLWGLLAACCFAGTARADIRIDLDGVDGELRRNVLTLLSIERYKDHERLEPAAVQRLYNRIDDEVRAALRPFGYYDPQISSSIEPPDKENHWHVGITIDPGLPVLVDTVEVGVAGPGATDPVFTRITGAVPIHPGDRLSHAAYEQLKSSLERAAATYGYLDARLERNELQVDRAERTAAVYLQLATGERYSFGATTIEQNGVKDSQVRRFLRYKEGDPYNALELLRTQFALDDSQYYSTVEVQAGERDSVHHTVPITIHASNSRIGYSLGAGYGTDTGVRGTASLTVPRVNSYGHRFRVQLQLSQIQQTFDTRYDVPFGDPALEKFSLEFLGQESLLGNNVTTNELAAGPGITQTLGSWQRVLTVNAVRAVTTDPIIGRQVDHLLVPSVVFASVPEGYLGEALFSRGLYAQLLGSTTALGARENFLRLDLQAERVVDLSRLWHLLLRSELGASTINNVEDLPGQYRFFAGGDRSVRGFAYDDLSPVKYLQPSPPTVPPTSIAVRPGGRDLLTGSIEIERDLPRNFGVALFMDGGNAVDHFRDPLAYSVGVGFRLRLPVVTVGLDVAQALRAPGFDGLPGPRLHLNISPKL